MAEVRPFRALRYDTAAVGPLDALVAPPYDVIGPDERLELLARSPYNVVHLTLPDSEEEAAHDIAAWQDVGVLRREDEPSLWILQQDYVGPDRVARTRTGLVGSLRVEPYDRRVVLPHERTHRGPKEGRLRLLRAVRVQLEPIFLLYDDEQPFAEPTRAPDLAVAGTRLWRLEDDAVVQAFADTQLLIADGHHRYETALAYHEGEGTEASAFMPVVLVSIRDPGLTIFPTHRVFAKRPPPVFIQVGHNWRSDPQTALRELEDLSPDAPAVVIYEGGRTELATGQNGELDVQLVDRLGHEGIRYTPSWEEAVQAVDSGEAVVAFLLRPTRIEDVFAFARRGEVLPQKTTYFYPKLVSGLLFHPA